MVVPVKCVVRMGISGSPEIIPFCRPHAAAASGARINGCSILAVAISSAASPIRTAAWRGPV